MTSLFTQFKNALGNAVGYAEVDLGLDSNGVPKRVPQSAPSDAGGAPLYAAGDKPALDGTDAAGVTMPTGGTGLRGWLSGIYAKLAGTLTVQGTVTVASLPGLVNGKLPVDIGGESITLTGPVTVGNEVEIKNDTGNPVVVRTLPGFNPTQTAVAVPAFVAGDTSGAGGTNGKVILAVTTTSSSSFLSIDNTGSGDAEVWFGVIPADAKVGQSPKQGKPLPAGAGQFFDTRIPVGPIYVTASAATGLSVVTG